MRKIVIGSGLGLVAAAMPAHAAGLPLATAPAGVSDAGRINFAPPQETQGILIGLNKPGVAPESKQDVYEKFKSQDKFNTQQKMNPYDKMNAAAQLKIKGESQIKLNGDGLKTGDELKVKGDSQIKLNGDGLKTGDQLQHKGESQIKLNGAANSQIKIKSETQLKTGIAGVQCDALGDGSVRPGQ